MDRVEEEGARRVVQRALRRTVVKNDNGSEDGMYDLRIGPADAPEVAIECVRAVDSTFTETWNVGPAVGPLALAVAGDWTVEIAATARVKVVKQHLERLLNDLEEQGIYSVRVDHWLERANATMFNKLEPLGITNASCYRTKGTGKVYLGLPGMGGAVDDKGSAVPKWLGDFVRDPAREDVLSKLQRSGAKDRHVFVIATFGGVPWAVESYLTGGLDHLPTQPTDLPAPVTAAWVVSGFGQRGLHWDGTSWSVFDAGSDDIDGQPSA